MPFLRAVSVAALVHAAAFAWRYPTHAWVVPATLLLLVAVEVGLQADSLARAHLATLKENEELKVVATNLAKDMQEVGRAVEELQRERQKQALGAAFKRG